MKIYNLRQNLFLATPLENKFLAQGPFSISVSDLS